MSILRSPFTFPHIAKESLTIYVSHLQGCYQHGENSGLVFTALETHLFDCHYCQARLRGAERSYLFGI